MNTTIRLQELEQQLKAKLSSTYLELGASGRSEGWTSEGTTALLEKATELEGELITLRGQLIGTGIWTSDGRGFIGGWHEGEQLGDDIAYERYELGLRTGHGFIDSISRKITQTG